MLPGTTPFPSPGPTEVSTIPPVAGGVPLRHADQLRNSPSPDSPPLSNPAPAEASSAMAEAPAEPGCFALERFPNLQVVEAACDLLGSRGKASIVVESLLGPHNDPRGFAGAIESLQGSDAKDLALAYAARKGLLGPSIGMTGGSTYPVTKDGEDATMSGTIHRYRAHITVNRGGL